jgi:hypothetical protein
MKRTISLLAFALCTVAACLFLAADFWIAARGRA